MVNCFYSPASQYQHRWINTPNTGYQLATAKFNLDLKCKNNITHPYVFWVTIQTFHHIKARNQSENFQWLTSSSIYSSKPSPLSFVEETKGIGWRPSPTLRAAASANEHRPTADALTPAYLNQTGHGAKKTYNGSQCFLRHVSGLSAVDTTGII